MKKYLLGFFMVSVFLTLILFLSPKQILPANALDEKKNEQLRDPVTGKTNFLLFSEDNSFRIKNSESAAKSVSKKALQDFGSAFGLANPERSLIISQEKQDELGFTHLWYNQTYQGIPVFGGQLIVHLNSKNNLKAINGAIATDLDLVTFPRITSLEAENKAKKVWRKKFGSLVEAKVLKNELVILDKGLLGSRKDQRKYLSYLVELYSPRPSQHEFYFIDAENGEKIYQITGKMTAINRRIADCAIYDHGSLNGCGLNNFWVGTTWGRSEGQAARGANPIAGGTDVDDLYTYTGSMHNYLNARFGRNGGNNQGGLGDGSESAVTNTDGYTYLDYIPEEAPNCPNAYNDGFSINFCQGLVSVDSTGHEYGHSVVKTSVPGGLPYSNESGALDEAYADIFGEGLENYHKGSSDWLAGAELAMGPIRSLINPSSLTDNDLATPKIYPDKFYHAGLYCGTDDGGGVHHNSTVVSHAAYLMAMGGNYNGCAMSGIGREKQEKIFYRALTAYFTNTTNFNGAYNALNAACNDLYGSASGECLTTHRALQAVELNQGGSCSGVAAVQPVCAADASAPSINYQSPLSGAVKVAAETNLYFELDDNNSGVNLNSLNVKVSGRNAILSGAWQSGFSGKIESSNRGYKVTIDPASDFSINSKITIEVSVSDNNGNSLNTSWSFTTTDVEYNAYLESKGIASSGTGRFRCGREKLPQTKIEAKAFALRKELEGASLNRQMNRIGVNLNNWGEYVNLYAYCDYPIDALVRYRFFSQVVSPEKNWYVYRQSKAYKDNIFKTLPRQNTVLGPFYVSYYANLRTVLSQETAAAKKLHDQLAANFSLGRIKVDGLSWPKLVNAYLYGGYSVSDVARAIYYGGKTVHPWLPKYVFEKTADYRLYSKMPVPPK